jgi:hypothetical protein
MSDVNYDAVDLSRRQAAVRKPLDGAAAEILQLIETAGHPGSISPTRLADRYDVDEEALVGEKLFELS